MKTSFRKRAYSGSRLNLVLMAVFVVMQVMSLRAAHIIQTFFVPFPEDDMHSTLRAITDYREVGARDSTHGGVGDEMRSIISIVSSIDATVIYYDHWEDGYEDDITDPQQDTTEIWGDGLTANGIPPGYSFDIFDAGDVVVLEQTISVPRNALNIHYDGGDKFSCTKPLTMSRACYAIDPGEVLAGAVTAFDSTQYGFVYRAPVGVDAGASGQQQAMFEYSSFFIMASVDYTVVEVDVDNDGTNDVNVTLDEGESCHVNGGVHAGATVTASKPVQCHLITGDIATMGSSSELWEGRFITLWPAYRWGTEYYTSVGGVIDSPGDNAEYNPEVFFFNPHTNALNVHYETRSSTGSVSVAANSCSAAFSMPTNSGARFYSTNDMKFLVAEMFDEVYNRVNFDWGLGVPPRETLTTMAIIGYGRGYGYTDTGVNSSPIWVTAVSNTTLLIDYDGDPDTGAYIDSFGNRYDTSNVVQKYESVRIYDPDGDQTGMRIYTDDGIPFVSVWGGDPGPGTAVAPYLDMGTSIMPFPTIYARKYSSLYVDKNTNGIPNPGDSLRFDVDVVNHGFSTAYNVIVLDEWLTEFAVYSNGTSEVNGSPISDDTVPPAATLFPLDEDGYNIGSIEVGRTSTVSYVVQLLTPDPDATNLYVVNLADVQWDAPNFTLISVPGLVIEKTSSAAGQVEPGTNITYTITVSNTGNFTYVDVALEDLVPTGVSVVPGSVWVRYPLGHTNDVYDAFSSQSYQNSDGGILWTSKWTEAGESDGEIYGDVQIAPDYGVSPTESFALRVQGQSNGVYRTVNLAGYASAWLSFDYRRDGLDSANDYVSIYVSSNGGSAWTEMDRHAWDAGSGGTDSSYAYTNLEISTYMSSNTAIRFYSSGNPFMTTNDRVWFDDVKITCAGSNVTVAGGMPPVLFNEYKLPPGTNIIVTMDVEVDNPPTSDVLMNTARVRARQNDSWEYASVTNAVNATHGLFITKTTTSNSMVSPGNVIPYTITVQNTGNVYETGVRLDDIIPLGLTYVPGSAVLIRPYENTSTYLDSFDSQSYSYNRGMLNWADDWYENGDDDECTQGDIQVANDGGTVPGHVYALFVKDDNNSIQRKVDLSSFTNASLSFEYRREGLDDASDSLDVDISSNGGSSWTTLDALTGPDNDGVYKSTNYSITSYISDETVVRFASSGSLGDSDIFWLDDITITAQGAYTTNRLPAPPILLNDFVLPGEKTITITLQAEVDYPPAAVTMINHARLRTDRQTEWIHAYVTNTQSGSMGITLTKTSSLNGDRWLPNLTNTYIITLVNTGDLRQTGVLINDPTPCDKDVLYVEDSCTIIAEYDPIGTEPVLHYPLNETNGTSAYDISGNSKKGTVYGGPTMSRTGVWETAYQFDESDDHIEVDNFAYGTNFTVSFWFKCDDNSGNNYQYIYSHGNYRSGAGIHVVFGEENASFWPNRLRTDIQDNNDGAQALDDTLTVTNNLIDGEWHHYACVVSNSIGATVYIDGIEKVTASRGGDGCTPATDLHIGGRSDENSYRFYGGQLDDVRVYDTALASSKVYRIAQATGTGVTTNKGPRPPYILENATLDPGRTVIVTLESTLRDDYEYGNVTNFVYFTSDQITNPVVAYVADEVTATDLLYVDAPSFCDSLSNQWNLACRVALGSNIYDHGAMTGVHPENLDNKTLRFYRQSRPAHWEAEIQQKTVSAEVLAYGVVHLYPGQNWVKAWGSPAISGEWCWSNLWCGPYTNTLAAVVGHNLPAGSSAATATRIGWEARSKFAGNNSLVTQEVYLASGDPPEWCYSLPVEKQGETAEQLPIPLTEAFIIELPPGCGEQKLPMFFTVITNHFVQTLACSNAHNMVAFPYAECSHPSELGLLEAGFTGGFHPLFSDWLWKYDRSQQLVPATIWYNTSEFQWQFTEPYPYQPVPSNYFSYNDGVVIKTRKTIREMTWTNCCHYSGPTESMTP